MPERRDLARLFNCLGDPTRLRIISILKVREACVGELVALLPIGQSAVSQHLRRLREAGLVTERRERQWVIYSLSLPNVPGLSEIIGAIPVERTDFAHLTRHPLASTCALGRERPVNQNGVVPVTTEMPDH